MAEFWKLHKSHNTVQVFVDVKGLSFASLYEMFTGYCL